MMEFTISRVALGMCGLIMLAAVLSPVTNIYDEKEKVDMQQQSENIAEMINTFYRSDADNMTLSIDDLLPSASSSLKMDGQLISLISENDEYRSSTRYKVTADKETYDSNDIVKLTKSNEEVIVKIL